MNAIDPDALRAVQQKVWGYRQGEMVSLMMHLGERLGLYRAMNGAGPVSAAALADITDLHERWLLEWLRAQAAAGLIDSPDGETFELTTEQAAVLADAGSLTYAGSAMGGPRPQHVVDGVANAFKTGIGLSYDDLGADEAQHIEKSFGNWIEHILVPTLVPAIPDIAGKLDAGATVADVGCGAGLALRLLDEAFPAGSYHGYEMSQHAIDLANERNEAEGRSVQFHHAGASPMSEQAPFDIVLTLDCLHDMTRPHEVASQIRSAMADDGVWIIKEIRSTSDFNKNRRNPMLAMMYSTSVMVCMSSAMSEPDGAGYGTVGLNPDALESLITDAGFSSIVTHDFEDPMNLYYEVRP